MTPMVDVVMVILVFFMASAAILGPEWFLKTNLPVKAPAATPGVVQGHLEVQIRQESGVIKYWVLEVGKKMGEGGAGREEIKPEGLVTRLRGQEVVVVDAGPDVPYEAVVFVHEMCARAGVGRVGVGMQSKVNVGSDVGSDVGRDVTGGDVGEKP